MRGGRTTMRRDQALQAVYDAIDVVNRQLPEARRLAKSPDTIIVGPSGSLDSLGIVNLVLAIEERASELLGRPVELLDDTAFVDANGPFRSVGSLAGRLEAMERS
jgi:hypothetical protein